MGNQLVPENQAMQAPIFVLGISQRSGTNYLFNLIKQHPSCSAPAAIWEDYLVCHSDLLMTYVDRLVGRWNWKSGSPGNNFGPDMANFIGDGLLKFLSRDAESTRFVTKTPDVTNVENFFKLFPQAYLIILVRDGRAVAESRVKSFHESYDLAIRKWSVAAKTIMSFQQKMQQSSHKFLLVRYEDLWHDVEKELRRIFYFCGLDTESYDYMLALNQPIKGSSEYRGEGHTEVHWTPIAKPADFNPMDRWKHWDRGRHALFNHLAGEYLEGFGYEKKTYDTHTALWSILVRALIAKSAANYVMQRSLKLAKGSIKGFLGEKRRSQIRSRLAKKQLR